MAALVPRHPRRLAYLGSPAMAVPPLRALHAAGFEIVLVVTNPDTRRGRGGATSPTPVKAAAIELGLPVTHEVDEVLDARVELGVVVAFGRLIRPHVLAEVPMINLHFSLLPRWRGAAPVERAILAGDTVTGVDLMAVDETLDTGPIFAEAQVEIGPEETADELRERLVDVGTELLLTTLRNGFGEPRPQVGVPVYADKLTIEDRHLDWSRSADELHRLVRVGGAWTTWRGGRCKVRRARLFTGEPSSLVGAPNGAVAVVDGRVVVRCGTGLLELLEVQVEGRSPQPAASWRNGARPAPGECFGT